MDITNNIASMGIVPVIKINDAKDAVPLCAALKCGGLPIAEITFRTAAAAEAIRRVCGELEGVLVGAGTVLTRGQVDSAVAAGAMFIVSPGLNPDVVKCCADGGVPIFPGCVTASEIESALSLGINVVKFFPAEAMGGIATIKALSAPYSDVRFLPTGGLNQDNFMDYLAFKKVIACGGSWMVREDLIANGNFDAIAELTRAAVDKKLGK
jgi:2-dehydro-3-deoxyphosphogluconate aldolase/(4S)-4-hydroxy-2-oxoglutarate aldolase